MYIANVYKIFLASPSDVPTERQIAQQVIDKWNVLHSHARKTILQAIGWETHSYSSMEGRPQGILNKQILQDADFLIGIFWCRIGTPTGEHESGTIEEIKEHISAGKPAMLCFSSQPVVPGSIDLEQYEKLMGFKKECFEKGLLVEYDTLEKFQDVLYNSLVHRANANNPFVGFEVAEGESVIDPTANFIDEPELDIPTLNDDEKKLLLEASQDPSGNILKLVFLGGSALQTNGKEMLQDNSPRERARWEAALNNLINNNLVEGVGYKGEIFKVTHYGYEIADRLRNT